MARLKPCPAVSGPEGGSARGRSLGPEEGMAREWRGSGGSRTIVLVLENALPRPIALRE